MSTYWSALYAEHATALASFLRKLTGDPELASELVQETFVRGIRSGHERELRTARAWLFRVADMDGVTEEAVKARLARGREAFARAFEQVGGDLR